MLRRALLLLLAVSLGDASASAQALRSIVVPADATIVIAPRGQAPPAPTRLRVAAPAIAPLPIFSSPLAAAPLAAMPLAAGVGLLLPAAAILLLGGGLPGSGGGTGAPANTR